MALLKSEFHNIFLFFCELSILSLFNNLILFFHAFDHSCPFLHEFSFRTRLKTVFFTFFGCVFALIIQELGRFLLSNQGLFRLISFACNMLVRC
jgi:hypothetical protein